MKKIILSFCLLINCICVSIAGEQTTDYLYATDIRVDSYDGSYYFNVCLEGSRKYVSYGVDIQLPNGWVVAETTNGSPNIVMIDFTYRIDEDVIYPYTQNRGNYTYYHILASAFPDGNRHHARVGCLFTDGSNSTLTENSGALFRVYIEKEDNGGWPLGSIKVYDVELNVIGTAYDCENKETVVLTHTGETALPFNVSPTAHWGTCILPFDVPTLPGDVKAYTSTTYDTENIYLTEATSLDAYTPYILHSETGYSGTVSGTVDPEKYPAEGFATAGNLKGAVVSQSITSGYVLQNLSNDVRFYPVNGTFNIPSGRCWMDIPADANARKILINETNGISNIKVKGDDANKAIYNLQGIRVNNTTEGHLFIKGGKKFLAK